MHRSMLLPVYIPTLIVSLAQGMLTVIMPLYALSFEIPYWLVGVVIASQAVGNLAGDVPAGALIQKLGHKKSMLIGISLLGLCMVAISMASTVGELLLFGFLSGLGNAMWNISRHAYITSSTSSHERGRAVSTFGGLSRVGALLGQPAGGVLAGFYGLQAPFLGFAIVTIPALIVSAVYIQDIHNPVSVHRGGLRGHSSHMLDILHAHAHIFITAGTGQLFAQTIRAGRNFIVPVFASEVLGLDVQAISIISSVSSAIDVAMFYPAGILMDRLGRKYAYVPSFTIMSIGMAMIPFTTGFFSLLAATFVVGLGNGLGSGTMLTLGSDLAPKESIAEFLGLWRLIGDSGAAGAPYIAGAIADVLGLTPATFVIALSGLAAAAILGLFVPETLHAASPAPAPGD